MTRVNPTPMPVDPVRQEKAQQLSEFNTEMDRIMPEMMWYGSRQFWHCLLCGTVIRSRSKHYFFFHDAKKTPEFYETLVFLWGGV